MPGGLICEVDQSNPVTLDLTSKTLEAAKADMEGVELESLAVEPQRTIVTFDLGERQDGAQSASLALLGERDEYPKERGPCKSSSVREVGDDQKRCIHTDV